MLRESAERAGDWQDKTMSALCARRLTACHLRLLKSPMHGLFDSDDPKKLHDVVLASYDMLESGRAVLFESADALRSSVLSRLAREALFISSGEKALLERLLGAQGDLPLCDDADMAAADSLRARLWLTPTVRENQLYARLPETLRAPLAQALGSKDAQQIRDKLNRFAITLRALLYYSGFLYASAPMDHFRSFVADADTDMPLGARYLHAEFECVAFGPHGMLIVHPGLADPGELVRAARDAQGTETCLSEDTLRGCIRGILPEEAASTAMMEGALNGALCPGRTPENVARDLRMLAKQGAPLHVLRAVMQSALFMLPTHEMEGALQLLNAHTVRWAGIPSPILQ